MAASGLTQCALYIPIAEASTATITLVLANSAIGATTVTTTFASAVTRYNDHNVASLSTNYLHYITQRLEAQESTDGTNGTYSVVLASSDQGYGPVYQIRRVRGHTNDDVTSLTLSASAQDMTDLGFAADTATPDSGTATATTCTWTAVNRAAYAWTSGVSPRYENGALLAHDFDDVDTVLATTSPQRVTYSERIARYKRKTIVLQGVYAAAVKRHYKDDAAFMGEIGAATSDPEAALARWCQRLIDSDQHAVRFVPDVASPGAGIGLTVTAEDRWRFDLREAIVGEDAAPRAFDLALTFDED
tara:strand:- start:2024 stop:2932 length:909 start_codon:yes stop_codon:yes gene_type:complete